MDEDGPVLSICLTCRDGREDEHGTRGGARLAQHVSTCMAKQTVSKMQIRGVRCMSQCKRSCVVSLADHNKFSYVFGDLDPQDGTHVQAIFELVSSYKNATEGFLERKERPNALQANILGRFPPLGSTSHLVSNIEMDNP